jgi:16S rRNA (guanine1207-N2)-methyltransferase
MSNPDESNAPAMTGDLVESYVHKTVVRRRDDVSLRFLTSQSLFSSHTIDPGTNLLLRTVAAHAGRSFVRCLDIGCGYGPIGASLAASDVAQQVDMADRDALALELAQRNVELNRLDNVDVFRSLGYDDVADAGYDLIVSNLPGKAGEKILRHLLEATGQYLTDEGQVWVVVVAPLRSLVEQSLAKTEARLIHVEHGARHGVYGYRPLRQATPLSDSDSLAAGIYARGSVEFIVGGMRYRIETSRGVDEFDGLSYPTKLLLEQLYGIRGRSVNRAVLFNVGQGYVPVAVRASAMTGHLALADRDLLALRTAKRNLVGNRLDDSDTVIHHQVGWLPPTDMTYGLIAGTFRGDETLAAVEIGVVTIADRLEPGGITVIAGGSTAITRMLKAFDKRKDVQVLERQRYRGASVVSFIKKS